MSGKSMIIEGKSGEMKSQSIRLEYRVHNGAGAGAARRGGGAGALRSMLAETKRRNICG